MLLYNFTLDYIVEKKTNSSKKRSGVWGKGGGRWSKGTISSCQIKYQGCNIQHNDYTSHLLFDTQGGCEKNGS